MAAPRQHQLLTQQQLNQLLQLSKNNMQHFKETHGAAIQKNKQTRELVSHIEGLLGLLKTEQDEKDFCKMLGKPTLNRVEAFTYFPRKGLGMKMDFDRFAAMLERKQFKIQDDIELTLIAASLYSTNYFLNPPATASIALIEQAVKMVSVNKNHVVQKRYATLNNLYFARLCNYLTQETDEQRAKREAAFGQHVSEKTELEQAAAELDTANLDQINTFVEKLKVANANAVDLVISPVLEGDNITALRIVPIRPALAQMLRTAMQQQKALATAAQPEAAAPAVHADLEPQQAIEEEVAQEESPAETLRRSYEAMLQAQAFIEQAASEADRIERSGKKCRLLPEDAAKLTVALTKRDSFYVRLNQNITRLSESVEHLSRAVAALLRSVEELSLPAAEQLSSIDGIVKKRLEVNQQAAALQELLVFIRSNSPKLVQLKLPTAKSIEEQSLVIDGCLPRLDDMQVQLEDAKQRIETLIQKKSTARHALADKIAQQSENYLAERAVHFKWRDRLVEFLFKCFRWILPKSVMPSRQKREHYVRNLLIPALAEYERSGAVAPVINVIKDGEKQLKRGQFAKILLKSFRVSLESFDAEKLSRFAGETEASQTMVCNALLQKECAVVLAQVAPRGIFGASAKPKQPTAVGQPQEAFRIEAGVTKQYGALFADARNRRFTQWVKEVAVADQAQPQPHQQRRA